MHVSCGQANEGNGYFCEMFKFLFRASFSFCVFDFQLEEEKKCARVRLIYRFRIFVSFSAHSPIAPH